MRLQPQLYYPETCNSFCITLWVCCAHRPLGIVTRECNIDIIVCFLSVWIQISWVSYESSSIDIPPVRDRITSVYRRHARQQSCNPNCTHSVIGFVDSILIRINILHSRHLSGIFRLSH